MKPDLLLPVIVQDCVTGEIRMLAYANSEAIRLTAETGKATFFSRSRNEIWEKGKTSGNTIAVSEILIDCDEDALIYLATPNGPSCHTGAATCFFRRRGDAAGTAAPPPQQTLLARLDEILKQRKESTAEKSYTRSLYDGGPEKIGAKLREEADELARAVASEDDSRVVSEAADVMFHVMVALRSRGVGIEDVLRELSRRTGTSGHDEKRART